jgi:hypothetical protein
MLRIHGDRTSLLVALVAHWADQQPRIPPVAPTWGVPRGGLPQHLTWRTDGDKPAAGGEPRRPAKPE